MASPILQMANYNRPRGSREQVDDGSDGPHDGDMRERVASLEARLDTLVPNLATKADIGEMRADIKAWMLGTVLVLIFGLASIIFAMTSSINSQLGALKPTTAAPSPQPIVIQVPSLPGSSASTQSPTPNGGEQLKK